MAHYQFESLHPYSDGNGRLGRLLVIVQLLRGAVIREPLLVVSPWFETRREQYQDALLRLNLDGDWDAWIAFFAEGVSASAVESQDKVERLVGLQGELRSKVQSAGKRGVAERLAADLVGRPYLTQRKVSEQYCSPSRAQATRSRRCWILEFSNGLECERSEMPRSMQHRKSLRSFRHDAGEMDAYPFTKSLEKPISGVMEGQSGSPRRRERVVFETDRHLVVGDVTLPPEGYQSRFSDAVNRAEVAFIPLLNVQISPLAGGEAQQHDFIVLGKEHIRLAYPLGESPQ